MCAAYGIEYLAMRVYIGIWLFVIAFFVSCVEGSVLVKVFTRFTEEIFASLICIIYIVESVIKLFKVRNFLFSYKCMSATSQNAKPITITGFSIILTSFIVFTDL